jgi:hypothetical protein
MAAHVVGDASFYPLLEGISDVDLKDGAGQVILELLEARSVELEQIEILDREDLRRAVASSSTPVDDADFEGTKIALDRALRLLNAGYYRSLLIEERERVGRVDYRLEAMKRFRERILRN